MKIERVYQLEYAIYGRVEAGALDTPVTLLSDNLPNNPQSIL